MEDPGEECARQAARILELEEQLSRIARLATAGIAFEVCGHDLVGQKWAVDAAYKAGDYTTAKRVMDSVFSALEFLQPLRVSGPHLRDRITGKELQAFVMALLRYKPYQQQVVFTAAALNMSVLVTTSRFVPAIHNLIINGLYWGAQAGGKAQVTVDVPKDGLLSVSDNGPGVSVADQARLFQPLFSRRIAGSGIGLHLCRENLRHDHLDVVYAGTGAGAVFNIFKPAAAEK